jgi:Mrp family chromosome partitioning ATPase
MKAFRETQSAATLLESPLLQGHLSELRETFDLILLDSSAAGVQQDGVELSTIVDGTILVVEAEKTRWQVAQAAREEIEARGGNVLGVLLNGLQFHIPAALYNRL